MQQTDRRGRGRERRERNSYRDEERSAKPRDSIRLFEFLQPQIVGDPQKEEDVSDDAGDDYAELEDRPTWERDGGYQRRSGRGGVESFRGGRGSYQEDTSYNRGRRGRGRGGSDDSYRDRRGAHRGRGSQDDSYRDRRESHRGRGSHQDQDWRGVRSSFQESSNQEQSWNSSRGYQDRRGSSRGGRRGESYRDIEDSYSNHRNYPSSRSPVDALVDDFNAWPGLDTKPKTQPAQPQVEIRAPKVVQQDQWAVEDFCLAKWESSDKVPLIHSINKVRTSILNITVLSTALSSCCSTATPCS